MPVAKCAHDANKPALERSKDRPFRSTSESIPDCLRRGREIIGRRRAKGERRVQQSLPSQHYISSGVVNPQRSDHPGTAHGPLHCRVGRLLDRLVIAHELQYVALRVADVEGPPTTPAVFNRRHVDSEALQASQLGVEVALVDLEREVVQRSRLEMNRFTGSTLRPITSV